MNSSSLVWLVAVIVIAVLGGWYLFSMNPAVEPTGQTQTNQNPNGSDTTPPGDTTVNIDVTTGDAPMTASVIYSASGFSPKTVTIKKGGTVTWADQGGGDMWVASSVHPTHSVYSGTSLSQHCPDLNNFSFDQCKAGTGYSFVFGKAGTWNYHNHADASDFGTVIVTE